MICDRRPIMNFISKSTVTVAGMFFSLGLLIQWFNLLQMSFHGVFSLCPSLLHHAAVPDYHQCIAMVMEPKWHQQDSPTSSCHDTSLTLLQATHFPPVPVPVCTRHLGDAPSQAVNWCCDGAGSTTYVYCIVTTFGCMIPILICNKTVYCMTVIPNLSQTQLHSSLICRLPLLFMHLQH